MRLHSFITICQRLFSFFRYSLRPLPRCGASISSCLYRTFSFYVRFKISPFDFSNALYDAHTHYIFIQNNFCVRVKFDDLYFMYARTHTHTHAKKQRCNFKWTVPPNSKSTKCFVKFQWCVKRFYGFPASNWWPNTTEMYWWKIYNGLHPPIVIFTYFPSTKKSSFYTSALLLIQNWNSFLGLWVWKVAKNDPKRRTSNEKFNGLLDGFQMQII